jgi:hypothetical protein
MISAFIFAMCLVALLQFFVSYCRSVIAASSVLAVSEQLHEVAGIEEGAIGGEQFGRLIELVRLCPDTRNDSHAIAAIRVYFRMLNVAKAAFMKLIPASTAWVERELSRCAHFAAVALDRRITYNRELVATQSSSRF